MYNICNAPNITQSKRRSTNHMNLGDPLMLLVGVTRTKFLANQINSMKQIFFKNVKRIHREFSKAHMLSRYESLLLTKSSRVSEASWLLFILNETLALLCWRLIQFNDA